MAKGKYEYWLTEEQAIKELKANVRWELVGNEKDLEDNIVKNIKEICNGLYLPEIKEIGRQKMIDAGGFYIKPDIMIRHIDGTMTIFEVKKDNSNFFSLPLL